LAGFFTETGGKMRPLNTLCLALLGCGFLSLAVPGHAAPAPPAPSADDPAIQAQIASAVQSDRAFFGGYGGKNPVPGVLIGVWDRSGGAYIHAFGYADLATHRQLTPQDHFRIGSITKTFVATVILQLVDEGKLNLDDPLSKFDLGIAIPNAQNITVRDLLDMRSGLFEYSAVPEFRTVKWGPQTHFDTRTIIKWALAQKPYFPPGTAFHYTNTNYLILGLIIEHITGQSVGEQIETRLLQPYQLNQTSYPATLAMPVPSVEGYGLTNDKTWKDVGSPVPISMMGSAGKMVSNLADMKRWVTLYVTGQMNGPATHAARLACIPVNSSFGYGLGVFCTAGWFGHFGEVPGYTTAAYYFPAQKITIVVLVNTAKGSVPGVAAAIFQDIAAIMTPENNPF
jgi:D-alanyl-D-alanine carboxypeptidase